MLTMVSDVNLTVPGEGTKLGSSGTTKEGEGGEGGEEGERGEGGEDRVVDIGIGGNVTLGEGSSVLPLSLV